MAKGDYQEFMTEVESLLESFEAMRERYNFSDGQINEFQRMSSFIYNTKTSGEGNAWNLLVAALAFIHYFRGHTIEPEMQNTRNHFYEVVNELMLNTNPPAGNA